MKLIASIFILPFIEPIVFLAGIAFVLSFGLLYPIIGYWCLLLAPITMRIGIASMVCAEDIGEWFEDLIE